MKRNFMWFLAGLLLLPSAAFTQSPIRVAEDQYWLGVDYVSAEDSTGIGAKLGYDVSHTLSGYLAFNLVFADKDPLLSSLGVSTPPAYGFGVGLSETNTLFDTGLEYWLSAFLGLSFGKAVEDTTDDTLMTSRMMVWGIGGGLRKTIPAGTDYTVAPFTGVSRIESRIDLDSEYLTGFDDSESDSFWGGSIGLSVGLPSNLEIRGSVNFSFESSDVTYGVTLYVKP